MLGRPGRPLLPLINRNVPLINLESQEVDYIFLVPPAGLQPARSSAARLRMVPPAGLQPARSSAARLRMVPPAGLEPARPFWELEILSLLRIPISPRGPTQD